MNDIAFQDPAFCFVMNSEEHTFSLAGFLQSGFCREVQDFRDMFFMLFRSGPDKEVVNTVPGTSIRQ
ncbi:hypothetical protein [Faecalibaculum rodentium]|uniref:hypothetical protein n=1 Tax=Faecalibaculum rodentium TaxID=1702221 RepID=UPI003519CAF0